MGDGFEALRAGRGVVDLSAHRRTLVAGTDARGWLHDLLTADVAGVETWGSVRSLLLTPTGRVRADVQVLGLDDGLLLQQDPLQPDAIADLLSPYVLSSDVRLDTDPAHRVLSIPGGEAPEGLPVVRPGSFGAGVDLVVPADRLEETLDDLRANRYRLASANDAERFRIWTGRVRFGVDLDGSHLPAEAGLEPTIDTTKGCFLGQESVARIRNLGHPRTVLRGVAHAGPPSAGADVFDPTGPVGRVTSAAEADGEVRAFARVPWAAREAPLHLADGRPLTDLPHED